MNLPFTTYLKPGTQFLEIDEIPLATAFARYPARDDETHEYAIERQLLRIEYESAVSRAIEAGTITPLNPFSLERHTFPHGNALKTAFITLEDYKRFAASLQIQVKEMPLPVDDLPNQFGYTIRGAAIAIAHEYEVPEQAMRDHIFKAAEKGELAVIDPQTGMPYTPEVRRDFYERIRIDDLNKWFETCGVPYRLGELAAASVLNRHRELKSQGKAPLQRHRFQEQEIIRALNELGHNPQSIPRWKAGESGVKSAIRKFLTDHNWSKKVFDKAWQRLRDSGEIAEV